MECTAYFNSVDIENNLRYNKYKSNKIKSVNKLKLKILIILIINLHLNQYISKN